MTLLSEEEITASLASSEWQRDPPSRGAPHGGAPPISRGRQAGGRAIAREWRFKDFREAIAFVDRVAEVAETVGHHPDIHVHDWNRVRLELSTHSAGGLTRADFDMASRIDGLA